MQKIFYKLCLANLLVGVCLIFSGLSSHQISYARVPQAADDPDINIRDTGDGRHRGWVQITDPSLITLPSSGSLQEKLQSLISVSNPADPESSRIAPQLSTLVGNSVNTRPVFEAFFQVRQWDWANNRQGPPIAADGSGNWGVTMAQIKTQPNETIRVPKSGGLEVYPGYRVIVLYAHEENGRGDVTIQYTTEDGVACNGYPWHIVDINVNDELIKIYEENEGATGRDGTAVALPCGYPLGTAYNSQVKVATRDTGSFLDPRSEGDWWHEPADPNCSGLAPTIIETVPVGECTKPESEDYKDPAEEGFTPGKYNCSKNVDEFHPLRPYPANACDPLIPQSAPSATATNAPEYKKYLTYACSPAITPVIEESFDPYGNSPGCTTDPITRKVTCYRAEAIDVTVNLNNANLGILGNTQDSNLTDEQKVNNYLSYYLTGVPQISDHETISTKQEVERLVNFSGPVRKLLPWDLQNSQARASVVKAATLDVHNYTIGTKGPFETFDQNLIGTKSPPDMNDEKYKNNMEQYYKDLNQWNYGNEDPIPNSLTFGLDISQVIRALVGLKTPSAKLYQSIPLSSVEDTAGEFILSVLEGSGQANGVSDPEIIIQNAEPVR